MKIVITNAVTCNGGDAAILLATVKLLRSALGGDTQFVIFDSQPEIAGRHYPELDFRELWHARATRRAGSWLRKPRRAFLLGRVRLAAACRRRGWRAMAGLLLDHAERRALDDYCTADCVVSTGGTYLVEHYPLRPRLFEFELALALGKPLVLFTQSLGPFRKPRNALVLGAVLRRSAGVLVRDAASRRHLLELRLAEKQLRLAADAAFALDAKPPMQRQPGEPLRVAVSVREWAYFDGVDRVAGMKQFTEAVAALTHHLIERHGAEVTFLSTCQGIPEYNYDDSKVAAAIASSLPESARSRVTVNREFHRPEELIQLAESFDLIVATRMHMAILSLVAGTPVLPIAYEFKTTELFVRLGLGEWVQVIENLSAAGLIKSADAFVKALPAIRESLRAVVASERASAESAGAIVKEFLEAK
jgi:colanic acid/amylovoran biosynthesis protein